MNDYSDRPYILFRFAEVYLIAAEAAFKGGATLQDAANMINVLRTRAALMNKQTPAEYTAAVAAQQITAAQVTLDFILDERSRELFAEDCRWWDLSRTKKLVDRVKLNNTEAAAEYRILICKTNSAVTNRSCDRGTEISSEPRISIIDISKQYGNNKTGVKVNYPRSYDFKNADMKPYIKQNQ
jgi:hypothetical protein